MKPAFRRAARSSQPCGQRRNPITRQGVIERAASPSDRDLARRTGDDFCASAIAADQPTHADRLAPVSRLGTAESRPVLNPDDDRQASPVRVVDADVEESWGTIARRGVLRAYDSATDRSDAAYERCSSVPADSAFARQRKGCQGTRRPSCCSGCGGCNRRGHRDDTHESLHKSSTPRGTDLTLIDPMTEVNRGKLRVFAEAGGHICDATPLMVRTGGRVGGAR
jgi:hypothetical protein